MLETNGWPVHEGGRSNAVDLPTSIAEAALDLRRRRYSCEELTRVCLQAIDERQPTLNAFITVTAEQALEQARRLDAELRSGADRGPLHGIPIVHKDLFDTRDVRTTVGSAWFLDRVPGADAEIVARLAQAGAVLLGKTHLNEFAAGTCGTNACFGDARNPWDPTRITGGSSSGTAVAVAAGLCLGGTASDTGGSIRIPASWNNITGIRPTRGRVSLRGAHPRAPSLDVAGPMARSAADVAVLLQAMVADSTDRAESSSVVSGDPALGIETAARGLRIGTVEGMYDDVDTDVVQAVQECCRVLAALGAELVPVHVPLLAGPPSHQSLFDILLYEFNQIVGPMFRAAHDRSLFGPIVRDDLAKGEYVSRETYEQALAHRARQREGFRAVFQHVDVLLTPTLPSVAPRRSASADTRDRSRRFVLPLSGVGVPCLSVPCGFDRDGLPVGMQLVGDALQESRLLRLAAAYQSVTAFHLRRPPAPT